MEISEFRESTKPTPRQDQIKESENEIERLGGMIDPNTPEHIRKQVTDKPAIQRMLKNIKRDLDTQRPKPYAKEELDSAVARERELREKWIQGMPTGAEMRKAPPGVLQKNLAWEKRNKQTIMEWKNICRRLYESGDLKNLDAMDTYGVSNVEMYRPTGGAQEGNFDNAQIPGVQFHMQDIPQSVVFTDEEIAALKSLDPELADKLATMPAHARVGVKEVLAHMSKPEQLHQCVHPGGCRRMLKEPGSLCFQHKPGANFNIDGD